MNFDETVRYLYSLGNEILALKLGLTTTELLLESLDNPHHQFQSVQIAGTNGKGSTAIVLDSICRSAGIKSGLFTSPHLVSITERIRVSGREISRGEFATLATRVRAAAEELVATGTLPGVPTFFEHVTAIAFLAFKENDVELAILETGLGGRLDSTTVACAMTVGITPISLDHQQYLGETLAEIAAEKAAIIRPGVTAVISPQPAAALRVILDHCQWSAVVPRLVAAEAIEATFSPDGRATLNLKIDGKVYMEITVCLRGRHQIVNVAVAAELAQALRERGYHIEDAAFVDGIKHAKHAGRLELFQGKPNILLDGAHNPAGASALASYLDEFVSQPITMVFGSMRDKSLKEMADILFPKATTLILTQPNNARAATIEELKKICDHPATLVERDARRALEVAREHTPPNGLICITGSLYLIGDLRPFAKRISGN